MVFFCAGFGSNVAFNIGRGGQFRLNVLWRGWSGYLFLVLLNQPAAPPRARRVRRRASLAGRSSAAAAASLRPAPPAALHLHPTSATTASATSVCRADLTCDVRQLLSTAAS